MANSKNKLQNIALESPRVAGKSIGNNVKNRMAYELFFVSLLRFTIKSIIKTLNNNTANRIISLIGCKVAISRFSIKNNVTGYNKMIKLNSMTKFTGFVFPKMLEIMDDFYTFVL